METLEQYGIKDVTPGQSAGCSERLRGEFIGKLGTLDLYIGDHFVGLLTDMKYAGKCVGKTGMYVNKGNSVWLDEVSYN